MSVSMSMVTALRGGEHNVVHLRERKLERLSDNKILELAKAEERIVLTFDLDFGDLMAASGDALPSVIIFRLRDERPISVNPRLIDAIHARREELISGAIVVIENNRHRIRRLPLREA
jgi:predicted nuclease of predicted toxin-antitoxin system